MSNQQLAAVFVGALSLGQISASNASLVSRLGGLAYYDTETNLTWLADANYAKTSGYDADGSMSWAEASTWVAQLNIGGITGWRLPETIDVGNDGKTYTSIFQGVDYGYNITTQSEMSNMFYNILGGTAWYDTTGTANSCTSPSNCLTNTGLFNNVQGSYYWSATEYVTFPGTAWRFRMSSGVQNYGVSANSFYSWAVHSGDVGEVPVPTAAWLFISGLLGLLGIARRKSIV